METGAMIERGIIDKVLADGSYIVRSLDRDGIISPPIRPINSTTYTANDAVHFYLFRDGTGKIICGD